MQRFQDKAVLITGGAAGIGRATAERLAGEGANLFLGDVQDEALEEAAQTCRGLGAKVEAKHCDVSDPGSIQAAISSCVAAFGGIDVLVNVAGIIKLEHTANVTLETWNRIMSVNLTGTFLMCQAALPHLIERRGNIVNISSTSALAGLPYGAAYGASKGGVLALTRTLAVEFGKQGVRANSICPGSILTAMAKGTLPEEIDPKLIQRTMALDKPRGPEVIAGVVAMLASEDGVHINGESIRVDGATLA